MTRQRLDAGILDALSNLGATVKAAAAADAPTDHPVGSAPSGDQPAETGAFAATNESDAKETAGPQGVDAAGGEGAVNPQKKQKNLPNQEELNPTSADDGPPEEIKPKKTVTSGDDDDKGELGGANEGSGDEEGSVSGVGGPKFSGKSAAVMSDCDDFLKEASAIIPVVETQSTNKVEKEAADVDTVTEKEASELAECEKYAQAQIAATLQAMGVADNAPIQVKRAALVKAMANQAEKAASGFILTLDPQVLRSVLDGSFQKAAQDDPSAAMAPVTGGDAMGGEMPPEAAAGGMGGEMPPEAAAGGGMPNPDEIIAEVLQAVEAGEIPPEEALQLLQQLGLPPEVLEQIAAQLGGAAGGGAGGEMPPEAAAAGGMPPEAAAAGMGGAGGSPEEMVTA